MRWLSQCGIIVLLLTASTGCSAKALRSKKFWIETGAVAAVAIVDAETAVRAARRDPFYREGNPLLPAKPRRINLYGIGALSVLAERGAIALLWQRAPQAASVLSTLATANRIIFHGIATGSNLGTRAPVCPANGAGCPQIK